MKAMSLADYRNAPRVPREGGQALLARRQGLPAPRSARGPPPPRAAPSAPPAAAAADIEARYEVEKERLYKVLALPQFATWSAARVVAELEHKLLEHAHPVSFLLRVLGFAAGGAQHKVSVRAFTVLCIKMGVVVNEEQARRALEAKGLATDGSLTFKRLLVAFLPHAHDATMLAASEEAQGRAKPPPPKVVLPLSARVSTQELAHALVDKLRASSTADSKLGMDLAKAIRQSGSADGPASTWLSAGSLVGLFRRFGIECSAAQAADIWAMYALPPSVPIGDFCDAFLDSNRNHVMHPRFNQPAPLSPRAQFPPALSRHQLAALARQAQVEAFNESVEAEGRPQPRPSKPSKARTPRRAEADERRARIVRENRERKDRLLAQAATPRGPPAPAPPPVLSRRLADVKARPLAREKLVSPRRLASRASPVELNAELPEEAVQGLLSAYTLSMRAEPQPLKQAAPPTALRAALQPRAQ